MPKLRPVHSFDLWGVVAHQHILGQRKIELYEKFSRKDNVAEEIIQRTIKDYIDMLDGQSWATGTRKSDIIDAIDAPTFAAGIYPDYTSAFIDDALKVMTDIFTAEEDVMIYTSKPASGLAQQLGGVLGKKIADVCFSHKHHPDAFKAVYQQQLGRGRRMVSHTADELPELIAAKKSGLFHPKGLIYINRNHSNSSEQVKKEGITRYVDDLRTVEYTSIAKKTSPTGRPQDKGHIFL